MPSRVGSVQPRFAHVVVLVLALALVGAACHRKPKLPDGDVAATLTVPAIGARAFDPASLRGKPSLVMFVSPTCSHCLAIIPRGDAAAKEKGANVVAVFVAGKAKNAEGVIQHAKFSGVALVDDGSLLKRYRIRRVPYSLVLGPDGRARDAFQGEQEEDTLAAALADAR
jgi:thiol-disulfide isomerase/thioredoxin